MVIKIRRMRWVGHVACRSGDSLVGDESLGYVSENFFTVE
jgi:hypothetical protein